MREQDHRLREVPAVERRRHVLAVTVPVVVRQMIVDSGHVEARVTVTNRHALVA